jgi:transcriptional regulator with XRE-family HTH domain
MKFGDYIRQQRENAGWTQPEAAAKIDIEQSYLSKLETGKSYPSEEVFLKLTQTYGFDAATISRDVSADELDRLKEISDVRAALLYRAKNETRFMRSWLIAGLIMVMMGGVLLGLTNAGSNVNIVTYMYRSEGVIKNGESPMIFSFLQTGRPDQEGKTLTDRIDYKYKNLTDFKGQSFIEKVDGGHRNYTMYEAKEQSFADGLEYLLGPAFMFILGGLACFYIARRWR